MTVKSMTGFSASDGVHAETRWQWEGRSVNGRNLELRFRMPPGFDGLERDARQRCQDVLGRGNCSISLRIQREAITTEIRLNEASLRQALAVAKAASELAAMPPPTLDSLLAMRGVVETVDAQESDEARKVLEAALLAGLDQMLEGLAAARAAEGERLAAIVHGQLDEIAGLVEKITGAASRQPQVIADRLAEQIARLTEGDTALDPERLHQEAVLLASKADVQEELDRLRAHIGAARSLLEEPGPTGRKLEFLAQEFNREANTICSKANDIEVSHAGLALKSVIDQFREQVANIE
ncbi:YicC/YloC family endoribonuclease [Methyloligella solikamskensis]|uniref:YicC/YloC family endoribonuclease n=1 Tax=Methyloligella solikamskensis TaxID=1177756 RepID=A0ABW3JAL3_9HYPH